MRTLLLLCVNSFRGIHPLAMGKIKPLVLEAPRRASVSIYTCRQLVHTETYNFTQTQNIQPCYYVLIYIFGHRRIGAATATATACVCSAKCISRDQTHTLGASHTCSGQSNRRVQALPYTTFFLPPSNLYGVVRSWAAIYTTGLLDDSTL